VLGLAKFAFPNKYEIYMHATSAQWLFARARRDLSHGCIRVEQPEVLAEWVLKDEPGWSHDRIIEAMHGSEPIAVKLNTPIQIVTMYMTAVALESGEVHFFEDIYGEDEALEKELSDVSARASRRAAPKRNVSKYVRHVHEDRPRTFPAVYRDTGP
jgi:murein L,D-transpeptidase YcbB/YkuD